MKTWLVLTFMALLVNPGWALSGSSFTEEVAVAVPSGGLGGSLLVPTGPGPFPVVLLISDGPQVDRDGNAVRFPGKNNFLLQLATQLADHRVASLRYDQRGVGASAKARLPEQDQRFDLLIDDAVAWCQLLREDPRFSALVVAGHGQGSAVGMGAAWQAGADGYVSLAGSDDRVLDRLREQFHDSLGIRQQVAAETVLGELEKGRMVLDPPTGLSILLRPTIQEYIISWNRHDPRRDLARLSCPVLILQGETDIEVSEAEATRLAAVRPAARLVVVPGCNHLFKKVPFADRLEQQRSLVNDQLQLDPLPASAMAQLCDQALSFKAQKEHSMARIRALNGDGSGLFPPAIIKAGFEGRRGGTTGEQVGWWARKFVSQGKARYLFGLAEGGYAQQGRLVLDESQDCVSLIYRATELARAEKLKEVLAWALRTRFAGAPPQDIVGEGGQVDYENPAHLDFSLDMIRSGIWGDDITSSFSAAIPDTAGTSRFPPGSFHFLDETGLTISSLQEGDVAWLVLNPANEKAAALRQGQGPAVGHLGIIIEQDGEPWLVHAASKSLAGYYQGGRVVKVPLGVYLQRVDRYCGAIITRLP